jgi:hypothetical protein
MAPKQIRLQAGLSITAAAALAGKSPNTWRAYELDRYGVTDNSRRDCDAAVEKMAEIVRQKAAA